jgi:hypothetical protein
VMFVTFLFGSVALKLNCIACFLLFVFYQTLPVT